MSSTSSSRRLVVAGATGALLFGLGFASTPASAQQRDFSNPLVTAVTDDLDITTLSTDVNAKTVSVRMQVEHLPTTFAAQALLAPRRTISGDGQYTYVIAEYADGAWRLTGSRESAGSGEATRVPTAALHATLDGGELEVTIDQAEVGWAGPSYAAAALVAGRTQVLAGAGAVRTPDGGFQTIDGFGPVSTDPDPTSTRLTVSRPSGTRPARLTAAVTPGVPGTVTFFDETRRLATVATSNGTATATLPPVLAAGTHLLSADFTPTDPVRYAASGATARLKVLAATLRLSARVQHRGRKPVRATVTVAGTRSGRAVLYDGARRIRSARFNHSTLQVVLPAKLRTGRHLIKAVVTSTDNGSTSTTTSNTARLKVTAH